MPIFDYKCKKCNYIWENIEVWPSHAPTECPECKSTEFEKVFGNIAQVRMDPDSLKSMPDPSPPLEELRGKTKPGCIGGYEDKPHAEQDITKGWEYRRDKHGNKYWREKRRKYFGAGGPRRSSAEGAN